MRCAPYMVKIWKRYLYQPYYHPTMPLRHVPGAVRPNYNTLLHILLSVDLLKFHSPLLAPYQTRYENREEEWKVIERSKIILQRKDGRERTEMICSPL